MERTKKYYYNGRVESVVMSEGRIIKHNLEIENMDTCYMYGAMTQDFADATLRRAVGLMRPYLVTLKKMEELVAFIEETLSSPHPMVVYDEDTRTCIMIADRKIHFEVHSDDNACYSVEEIEDNYNNVVMHLIGFTQISE